MTSLQELSAGAERSGDLLAAQLACQDVIDAFAYYVDNGMASRAAGLFTDDGELGSSERTIKGREGLEKTMAAREADSGRRTRHVVSNIVFERLDAESARTQSVISMYVLGGEDQLTPRAVVVASDEFARGSDGRWRFSKRLLNALAGGR